MLFAPDLVFVRPQRPLQKQLCLRQACQMRARQANEAHGGRKLEAFLRKRFFSTI